VHYPLHFEVGHKGLVPFFGMVVVKLTKALEALRLVVEVWLPHHSGDPLDHILFLVGENENHVLHSHESMAEFSLGHFGG
jgi:hypothetical protein